MTKLIAVHINSIIKISYRGQQTPKIYIIFNLLQHRIPSIKLIPDSWARYNRSYIHNIYLLNSAGFFIFFPSYVTHGRRLDVNAG